MAGVGVGVPSRAVVVALSGIWIGLIMATDVGAVGLSVGHR